MNLPDVWEMRWKALDGRLAELQLRIEDSLARADENSRMSTIHQLTVNLRIFATAQFHFFTDGLPPGDQKYNTLDEADAYSRTYALRSVINQAFEDVKIIEQVANQRNEANAAEEQTLLIADKLAWDALQPAIESNLISPDTTVLTYFGKNGGSIRIIPYAPVALIGLPFSIIESPLDMMAIPHEIGHYVYRRGRLNRGVANEIALRTAIANDASNDDFYNWIEELTADLYGAQVGGPAMALSFQDLQLEFSDKRFVMDDGEHPSPILRPHIYNKALNSYTSDWAKILDQLWLYRRQDTVTNQEFGDPPQSIDAVLSAGVNIDNTKSVDALIEKINTRIASSGITTEWSTATWWNTLRSFIVATALQPLTNQTADASTHQQVAEAIYTDFYTHFFATDWAALTAPPELDVVDTWDSMYLTARLQQLLPNWPAPYIERMSTDRTGEWWVVDVLFAGGWNTFGNGQWTGGP